MRRLNIIWIAGFAWVFWAIGGCATMPVESGPPPASAPSAPPFSPPVITKIFASPHLRPGETWRVYLIASARDGVMKNIVCTIDQPGVGTYQPSITRIDPSRGKELNGYIYLPTSVSDRLDNVTLTLTVQIQDTAGRYSNAAQFNLEMNYTYQQEPPPPGVFQENDLGPIMIPVHGLRERDLGPSIFFPRLP